MQKRITNLSDLPAGNELGGGDQSYDEQTEHSRRDEPLSKRPRIDTTEHTADQRHDADGGGQLKHGRTDLIDRSAHRIDDTANGHHSCQHQRDHTECVDGLLDLTGLHTADDADGHRSQQECRGKLRHHLADAGEVDALTEDAADEHDIGQKQLEPLHDLDALVERLVVERTHDLHGDRQQREGSTDRQHQAVDRGDVLERSELELAHDRAQTNHDASHECQTTGNGANGSDGLPHLVGIDQGQGRHSTSNDADGLGNRLDAVGDVDETCAAGRGPGELVDGLRDRRQDGADSRSRGGQTLGRRTEGGQSIGELEEQAQRSSAQTNDGNGAPVDVAKLHADGVGKSGEQPSHATDERRDAVHQALNNVLADFIHHGRRRVDTEYQLDGVDDTTAHLGHDVHECLKALAKTVDQAVQNIRSELLHSVGDGIDELIEVVDEVLKRGDNITPTQAGEGISDIVDDLGQSIGRRKLE